MADQQIDVEVAYATPDKQLIIPLQVDRGVTVEQAVKLSGVLEHFPEIDPEKIKVGIFGKVCKPDSELQAGERVEIYRPLLLDPKEHRRQRAAKFQENKS